MSVSSSRRRTTPSGAPRRARATSSPTTIRGTPSADGGVQLRTNAGTGNAILGNTIHSNGGLGIDLNQNGVTANDALDGDPGPNDLLNFPLLTASYPSGVNLTTYFQLDVPAGAAEWYRIEFFRNPLGADGPTPPGTGFGEGQIFAGSRTVNQTTAGPTPYTHTFPGAAGDVITATTTRCTDGAACTTFGSTSEFSKALNVATTAVTLLSFSAAGREGAVDLSWTTASELSNLGFHLYRAEAAGGPLTRITSSLIPGSGFVAHRKELRVPGFRAHQWPDVLLPSGGHRNHGSDGKTRSGVRDSRRDGRWGR